MNMYTQFIIKKNYFVSLQYLRMSGKNINFNDKKIKKSIFYKNKAINNIEDININHMVIKTHLNTLLDTITMISLDQYI